MTRLSRRTALQLGAGAGLGLALPARAGQRVTLNDASRLNVVPVAREWAARPDSSDGFIQGLRAELKDAAAARRPVAIGVARHSMGGQSLARDGTALSFDRPLCVPVPEAGTYRAYAGTRWRDVIGTLDPLGFSPAVMQSNNDFGVASTFAVNAHGWPVPRGPFGSTVRSLRLMLADGTLLTCSRTENEELFRLAMGGYGLFGVIVDLEVEMVPNLLLVPTFVRLPSAEFAPRFLATVQESGVEMAYGRLSTAHGGFLEEALMVTYRPMPPTGAALPPAGSGGILSSVSREIYRAQVGSETAKRARWFAETVAGPRASSGISTRNTLMNEPVSNLEGRDRGRTDILHEYFVPPERFPEFITAAREVILASRQEFLNVTLRYVATDALSVLAYAPGPRIAAVMSFSQAITPEAEADMLTMTEALIERVLDIGGTFYLPYRLHARRDQVARGYPNAERFVERKRHYDQGLLFRNLMWDAYFG